MNDPDPDLDLDLDKLKRLARDAGALRIAYADPPYLGNSVKRYGDHPNAAEYDTLEGHKALIGRLQGFDGWALSMASTNLRELLPYCPADARVMAWVKPFAIFKPNVNPAYAWEPVIVKPARRLGRDVPTSRDWVSVNITLRKGVVGAKPKAFSMWLFQVLGMRVGDEFVDLFPGSGSVADAYAEWLEGPKEDDDAQS